MTSAMTTWPRYTYGPLTQPSLVCLASEEASVAQLQGPSRNSRLLSVRISLAELGARSCIRVPAFLAF